MIDQIRTAVPDASIVVSTIPRVSDAATLARIQAYNSQIPGIVASKGSKVTSVDAFAAITPADLASDGTHLTNNGYGKLATVWYPTVHAILDVLAPPTIPPPSCSPRPRVVISTAKGAFGHQTANIATTGAGNWLLELRFGDVKNATVTVAGQSGQANLTVTLSGTPTSVTIDITREHLFERVQVPVVAVDRCGD